MKEYVVGRVEDIAEGKGMAVKAGQRIIAVFRIKDEFYAVHNTCPHKGCALCNSEVVPDKLMIRCPWHLWNWRLDTGELEPDPRQKLKCYDIKVVDGEVVLSV